MTLRRRRTDAAPEHIRNWRPLASLLICFAALYGLLLLTAWLS
jgi:hypothetical protein